MTPFKLRARLKRLLAGAPPAPKRTPRPPPPHDPGPPAEPEEDVPDLEVDGAQVAEWIEAGETVLVLDVREPREVRWGVAEGSFLMPTNQVPQRLDELPDEGRIVVLCAAGARSFGVAHYLRDNGFPDSWSLSGGIGDWRGGRHKPPDDAPRKLLDPIRVSAAASAARGHGERELSGTLQEIHAHPDGHRFSARVTADGQSLLLQDLGPEDLLA